jgi:hypothetical protein
VEMPGERAGPPLERSGRETSPASAASGTQDVPDETGPVPEQPWMDGPAPASPARGGRGSRGNGRKHGGWRARFALPHQPRPGATRRAVRYGRERRAFRPPFQEHGLASRGCSPRPVRSSCGGQPTQENRYGRSKQQRGCRAHTLARLAGRVFQRAPKNRSRQNWICTVNALKLLKIRSLCALKKITI